MIDNFMQVLKLIKEKRTNNVVKKSDWDKGDLYKTGSSSFMVGR
ncbi:hypothetical protein U7U_01857 [Staphylococcus aureus M1322]|nr:hypothetical protein U7U_01857 [Staphylococcus aureus M1322]